MIGNDYRTPEQVARDDERMKAFEALRKTVNEFCHCGGKGPDDPNVCDACAIYHEFEARM